jgi:hypothetical protein
VNPLHELSLWAATKYQVGKAVLQERLSEDRGEGAVSTAVIVAIVAAAAVALGIAITAFVTNWVGKLNACQNPGATGCAPASGT